MLLDTQIVVNFDGTVTDSALASLALQVKPADADDDQYQPAELGVTFDRDAQQFNRKDNQFNPVRLNLDGALKPNSTYAVTATGDITVGNTTFRDGKPLFSFTTRPGEGRPANGDFQVTTVTPGEINPATQEPTVFTQFNAIRVILNEPVNPATVNENTFFVEDSNGNRVTDARLTALGRYIVFDPNEDLAPGDYTVSWTSDITSVFGKSLTEGSEPRTVLTLGNQPTDQTLIIEDGSSAQERVNLPDSLLSGLKVNNVNIDSQLIGSNDQPVLGPEDVPFSVSPPLRNRVATTLATPGTAGYGDVIPAVIPAGQKFQLKGLKLFLGGEEAGVETPIDSGPIDVNFINDVSVYLMANDYRNVVTPTAVQLRFDLGIGTLVTAALGSDPENFVIQQLANGVFNQSVLNIQGAGLAIPRGNGDLEIQTLGTFPINVNRTDNATVNFQLTLVLPANPDDAEVAGASDTQDSVGPVITARSPSACLYAFGSPLYDAFYTGAAPTAFPEPFCTNFQTAPGGQPLPPTQGGGLGVAVNSFPIESSPAIVFSSPIDPNTVNAQSIQLASSGGTPLTEDEVNYRVEGFSVVIDPVDLLAPDTDYTISLPNSRTENQLRDLDGNPLSDNAGGPGLTMNFRTEPQVATDSAPPLLGTLSPGIPCALETDNVGDSFVTGGDTAGNCVGSSTDNAAFNYPVFQSPVNVPVDAVLSKFVDASTIVLADGCLTAGSGEGNGVEGASVALQEMDGNGQCVGAVDADIALANPGDAQTRSFTIRPTDYLEQGTRYWIVVCGTEGDRCTGGSVPAGVIADLNGAAVNTDPLNGTGSTDSSTGTAGGPDIVMPFDAIAANNDYYTTQFTLPETDTNGNGRVDDGERLQPGNRALLSLEAGGIGALATIESPDRPDGKYANYLSLARPIAIREATSDCARVDAVQFGEGNTPNAGSAVGETPETCVPVSLLPGGITSLTGVEATATLAGAPLLTINTGRILLRFPNDQDANPTGTPNQTGYIVERCTGQFPGGVEYDFEPCFAASLNLVANAPDGENVTLDQQQFAANLVGPVTFEQNGRLVISLRNANQIELDATASLLGAPIPATATIEPAELTFQLVGNAVHGGRAFPNR
ncbi:Ig-like domain-containing protein [Salinisphaera shabanensis]|uniref:Ig-like domain-containing protein n=1 Tax=Salinisphaera shabanensis TaxID=180542 RepID=UPI0002123954|nr:Ig-like domain-containing protein [Salinisphaera shabanensis]